MKRLISGICLALLALSGCSSEPSPADKTEDGVQAALRAYVEAAYRGDRTEEQQRHYCEEILTAKARQTPSCHEPITGQANPIWKEIHTIQQVTITGDKATVEWTWNGRDDKDTTHGVTSSFYYEEGTWRYQYGQ